MGRAEQIHSRRVSRAWRECPIARRGSIAWRRTLQTAGILAAAFTHGRIKPQKALRPGGSVAEVDAVVAQLEVNQQHCLLVSHQPLVSYVLDHYLGKQHNVPTLPPGGLVTLSLDPPAQDCGTALFWMFPPDYAVGR